MQILINNGRKTKKNRLRLQKHRKLKKIKQTYTAQVGEYIKNRFKMFEIATSDNLIEDPSDINNQAEFKDKSQIWVKNRHIARRAVNELLLILISAGFGFLPKDSRTLMSTLVIVPIYILSNGKMWYFGFKKCLKNVLADI